MTARLQLENFDTDALDGPAGDVIVTDVLAFEQARGAAYTEGYRAAEAALHQQQVSESAQIERDLIAALQNLSLTWHEARGHILQDLRPLLQDIIDRLLPRVAQDSLGGHILQEFARITEKTGAKALALQIHPSAKARVAPLLAAAGPPGLALICTPKLTPAEAVLRFEARDYHLDLNRALQEISRACRDYFTLALEDQHG